jgi:hypothetical protein
MPVNLRGGVCCHITPLADIYPAGKWKNIKEKKTAK